MARPRKPEGEKYKTPTRSFRIPNDIYRAAQTEARLRGETVTDVIIRALEHYGRPHRR